MIGLLDVRSRQLRAVPEAPEPLRAERGNRREKPYRFSGASPPTTSEPVPLQPNGP
jgi:hypothetical protein